LTLLLDPLLGPILCQVDRIVGHCEINDKTKDF